MTGICVNVVYLILTETLKMNKVCARWVPRLLTEDQKAARNNNSRSFLSHYDRDGCQFLHHIVTIDETWMYMYEPESKQQSMIWKHTDSPLPKKAGKFMFMFFMDAHRLILSHAIPAGTIENAAYYQKYRELFECFGIPCVQSQGEAEALCAHLEKIGICHGCFTNDSDYFCYGGRSMYRKLAKDKTQKKDYVVEEFMFEEEAFSQKDFVALALLIGCDFGKGIQGIGPEKGRKLLEGLKGQGFNTLDRIFSWPNNTELDDLELQLDNKGKKKTHCKTCNHEGSEGKHEKKGCQTCGTEISCTSTSPRLCDCEWHACDRKLEPVSLELSIRKKSRANPDFPSAEIRDEFLNNSAQHCFNPSETRLTQGQLDIRKLVAWLTSKNVLREADILRYIIPLVLLRQMRDPSLTEMFTPLRIQKKCKENHEQCYQVLWDKSDQNTWARPPYETSFQEKVSQQLFQQRYPHLVRMFEEPNPGASKGKRKKTQMDTRQRTLKHYYLVKKKKLFREETKP